MRTVSAHTDLLNTMFRHKGALINTSVILLLLVNAEAQSNSRSYDTNDWIPVSRSCPTCFQNEDTQSEGVQKRPTGRVLNLPSPDQKRFFPTEQSDSSPQSYNIPLKQQEEKQQPQQQARLLQNQGQYSQPQIVLPPQLQSLINQGQPFLSPQRINNQLLQALDHGAAYQPTLQTVPQFALNSTQFNSQDMVQNINLGLYNQQSTKQQPQISQPQNIKPNGNSDREEVQLLYVPLENLRQRGQRQQIEFPNEQRLPTPQAYNQPTAQQYQPVQHKQAQLQNIQQDFVQQALQAQKLQEQFQHNVSPVPQQGFRRPYVPDPITHEPTTTPAPKKRKPHQPPLAVYMGTEGHSEIKLGDVLTLLKDAKTISVQDNIGPDAPQVFVGPSHLAPPDGYVKFDLPYLSSIESNRVERKVDQLPFFVAPLSYKAPPGYSKIPFPAPHVGSVVINHIQASSQEQTTTENIQHFLNQNIQETSSPTPYSSAEITTIRTRGRQRQPSRASYAASTVQSPVTPEIPYGPLPTKASSSAEQQHSVQESLISPNPYGPTQFVQSTTPSIYENPASLPQQIFSTKNRFSTPNYNVHNVQSIPERHNQFVQQVQQEVESTEHTPLATTLSDVISDEKYTVLEQFPLPLSEKSSSNKYSQINVAQNTPQRVPNRQHSRGRPTENYYNDESKTETPLPLVSNEQYSNEQYLVEAPVKSPFLQNQQEISVQQYVTQAVPTKQIPLEHYGQDTKKSTAQEPLVQHQYVPQEIPTKEIPLEHYNLHQQQQQQQQQYIVQESPVQLYSAERPHQDEVLANQQYSTEQTSAEYEKPVRQSRPHSRVRGKQHFTQEPYYREQYETPNVKETSTRHEPLLNQQVVQHQTPVYDSREQDLPVSTQPTRGRGRPEHSPETYFKEDYVSQNINETPVRHEVALNKQVNTQSAEYVSQEIPLLKHQLQNTRGRDYDSQEISLQQVNPQVTRGRGKSQFTPETYKQEYEQHSVKPTEPEVHVTKKPIVNYEIPIISTQKSIELTRRPQYDPETYYRDVSEQPRVQEQQQQYTLPSQLPPISPHLPGLVNSLQDQAIRPLLAPLLLPPSEEPPVTEYTSEYYTTPFTTTITTTTTTTTTPVPIIETTTQFKRTRGRQRGTRPTASYEYVNTTPTSHQRTSSYRGRRPYTRTRQQSQEKNLPVSSTAQPEVVTETSTRAAFNRNRYVQRERQYVSSTEQPRRQPTNSRQRFRTRGRPLKTDEEYAVRSSTENVPDFKQPSFEGAFEASLPIDHSNVELPVQIPTNNPQFNIQNDQFLNHKQKEQALVYVQNSNKQIVPENNPIPISSEEYIPREHFISSTEIVEPLHQTTIAASAPENNIVSDVLHNEPVVLVNHKINQQQSNYPNVEFNTNRNVEYNSNEEINVNTPRVKYNEEPEVKIQPTTESVRTRSRIRGRPRTRGYQSTSSSRYQAPSPTTTTTTTQRTTTESKDEDQEEFYGFFRPPSFVKPIKMEYKPSSELRTAVNPTPSVAYLHSPASEEQNVYVSPVGNPVYSTPATHLHVSQVDDSQADHNIHTQYVSSTPDMRTQYAPPAESSEEEEVVDIKPVTRRPSSSSFNRARRPVAPAKVEDHTEIPSRVTEKYYIVRPTKRPETQTPKVTRIRGRIRRPTRPTTIAPTIETESSYSGNQQQQHYSRTNELSNTHSDEYVAPVKTRQRITNRGKSHFQLPRNEKIALEPESNNYPPSFLQAQQNHHQQADATVNIPEISAQKSVNIVSAVHTAKPSFQLTIEPEDGDEEYADQVPYTSVNKHRIDINLDEGAESKYSAKIVAKPSNYNFIVTNEKNNGNIEKTTEKQISTETIDITTVTNEPVVTETEEPLDTFQQITTAFPEIDITQSSESTTTDVPTTLEPVTDTPQARRRGIWRLVKLRPVGDDFESAESQNIGTVFNNNFDAEKPVRKYHSVKRIRTTTEEAQEEITTVEPPKVVNNQQNDVPTPESDIFAPLYEMFGYTREGSILDNGFDILPSDDETVTTTVLPTVNNIYSDDVELTTLSNYNTTEIKQDFSSIKEDKIEMYPDRLTKLGDKEAESSTEDTWRTRIIGTSTTTEVSHETEICYRGRCIKSSSEESSERL